MISGRYLNIDNPSFEVTSIRVNQIYQPELQPSKAYASDTETPFLDLHLSVSNGFFQEILTSAMILILT